MSAPAGTRAAARAPGRRSARVRTLALDASRSRGLERLARWGLVVRGVIYFVPGFSALQWALGREGRPMTQAGTIQAIGQQPLGRALLVVVAAGLAGYAVWGIVRAVFDPLHRGRSPAGLAQRIGYAFSAVAYTGLFAATLRLLTGNLPRVPPGADWTVAVLARPFGGVVVVTIGMCWIFGSGIAQVVTGWRRGFERDLSLERLEPIERRAAVALGRIALVSRGIVFTIIGALVVAAGLRLEPGARSGLEGALIEVAHQPFGLVLLGAAGLGLMAFGTYSALCARWMRMRHAPPAHVPHSRHRRLALASTDTGVSS